MTLKSTFTSLFHLPPKNTFRWLLLALLPLAILFGVTRWSAKGAWEVHPPNAPQVSFNMALQMAYFTQDNDWDSTIVLNNNAKEERFVQVTLYGKGGQPLNVPAFSIPANSIRRFKLADWTRGANNFREGNINVATHGKPMEITGQVSIVNRRDRLEFESKPSMTAEYSSQRLNGIVTLPDKQAKAYVALTNTSANPIEVSLTSDSEHVHADKVNLAAHETKVEEIKPQNSDRSPLSALVTLQHNGSVGALITAAYVVNNHTGFTANLYFYDDAKTVSNKLAGAHFRLGEANPAEGFPAGTVFKAPLVLANLGNAPSTATVTVTYTQNGQAKTQSIGSFRLASRAVKEIELYAILTRLGVTGLVDNAGVDIKYTGLTGRLVGQLTSMSTDGDYSFDVPVKDPLAGFNRNTGSYPFRLDGGYNTVLHLKNTTDKPVYAVAQIRYEGGGTYNPDQIKLEPFQTVAMDIKRFQATQARDIRQRALPMDVVSGKIIWYERTAGSLIGRAETADFSAGIAGSFSCGGNCSCGMQTTSAYMDPYYFLSEVGDHGYPFTPMESLEDCNGDYDYGPYAITSGLSWNSSNSSVATVSSGYVVCVSNGTCNINFTYNAVYAYDGDYSCNPYYNNFYGSGTIDVKRKIQVTEVGFKNDHSLWKWHNTPANWHHIDATDGTEPTWKKTGNPNYRVAYTKSTSPTVFAKLTVTPAPTSPTTANVRIKIGSTVVATVNSVSVTSGVITLSDVTISQALPGVIKVNKFDYKWEATLDGGTTWQSAGESGEHRIYTTAGTPQSPMFQNFGTGTTYSQLFDKALEEACDYIDGATGDINDTALSELASGTSGDIYYDPSTVLPPGHPLMAYSTGCLCADFAQVLRGLVRSLGGDAPVRFMWGGLDSSTRRGYAIGSGGVCNSSNIPNCVSLRVSRSAKGLAPANPHFTYHAGVYFNSKIYDAVYGDSYTSPTFTETANGTTPAQHGPTLGTITYSGWTCGH